MTKAFTSTGGLHVERGGSGERVLVLLHGMGANSSVWRRMIPIVETRWSGRWLAPDFRGHGRSLYEPPYGYGIHAADIAAVLEEEGARDVTVLGHSFGGLIGALIGTGWFGVRVRRVAAVGVKIVWSGDEIAKAHEVAQKPARAFSTRQEAIDRYLKVSGLYGLMDPNSPDAVLGVREREGAYSIAFDTRATGGVGPSIEMLLKLCAVPLRLSAGTRDPMVTLDHMRRVDPAAVLIDDAGHNAHWEAPEQVWKFFEEADTSDAAQDR
jgi:pimeloyl-ACP methyl ester carboxylesterase